MMSQKPLLDTFGFSIGEQIKHVVSFKINDDGSIAFSPFPGEVVNPNRLHLARRWIREEKQGTQKGLSGQLYAQLFS
jgi:hypothetical protein